MKELFEKEGQSIFTFKKGDIIIRLKPRAVMKISENENLGVVTEVQTGIDNSFREPIEFVAIENNQIYLRHVGGYFKGRITTANLEDYVEDWALFVLPDGLTLDDCF